MSIDPAVKKLILSIRDDIEPEFVGIDGSIDKMAMGASIREDIEERHEDARSILASESPTWVIIDVCDEDDRRSRASIKKHYAEIIEAIREDLPIQPELPDFDKVKRIKVAVHKGGEKYAKKQLLSCTIRELDIIDQSYGGLADTLLQHQLFVRALAKRAREMGFKDTDTVLDLYQRSA